jgi:mannose-6-phosphate isomerase-like protein (cupin superfamily)
VEPIESFPEVGMKLHRYEDTATFPFGPLVVRDMVPAGLEGLSIAEIEVPIGADNPPYAAASADKIYVGITGDIEFQSGEETARVRRGDVLVVRAGETYSYHNGGYEMGRLLLLQIPPVTGS